MRNGNMCMFRNILDLKPVFFYSIAETVKKRNHYLLEFVHIQKHTTVPPRPPHPQPPAKL